jgi:hypothetical protein
MHSWITSVVLGLGILGASAALPQRAQAAGPWQFGRNYQGYYSRYYSPGFGYVVPPVAPAYVAPATPYLNFSLGIGTPGYGSYWGNRYYNYHNYHNYRSYRNYRNYHNYRHYNHGGHHHR